MHERPLPPGPAASRATPERSPCLPLDEGELPGEETGEHPARRGGAAGGRGGSGMQSRRHLPPARAQPGRLCASCRGSAGWEGRAGRSGSAAALAATSVLPPCAEIPAVPAPARPGSWAGVAVGSPPQLRRARRRMQNTFVETAN
ncbi:transmembrane protein 263 isoform X3 [Camarhynchus parvulus]|uniref:transmembrane protein 263 isoform X3 n=1 Tax=Geospiza parvula TaxID=87175 RepID=UPI001238330A|nr:transmembrane protein 263 isoform X3 [Camarhynchus parvulus]